MGIGLGDDTGALRTTPWARREDGGVYIGHDKSVWLYRELPLAPLQHEDPHRRLEVGGLLDGLLEELGSRSRDIGQGMSMLSQNRMIHIFGAVFDTLTAPPPSTPEPLEDLLSEILPPLTASKTLMVGIKLRSAFLQQATKAKGVGGKVKALLASKGDDLEMNLDTYAADFNDLEPIFRRHEGRVPRTEALNQLEAWWNNGQTPDQVVEYSGESFRVPRMATYEISAVQGFPQQMRAPFAQWALEAMAHPSPAIAISVRAELEPATVTRSRLRRMRRRLIAQEEEEAATGDLAREENTSVLEYAKDVESYVTKSRSPWLANASILMARIEDGADETYKTMLSSTYKIQTQPLTHRQLEGLNEFQPTSPVRINPFPQDLNLAMVSYAGLGSFSNLGDASGVYVGSIDPDYVPCYLDVYGASTQDTPPVMGIFGDPGSGKTFLAQLIAAQAALSGETVFFINPKGHDSLAPWTQWVASRGAPARVVSLSKMTNGAFDPFSFCADPHMAAEILGRHIMTVLGSAASPHQGFVLMEGLTRGASAGATCAMDALAHVQDEGLVRLIKGAIASYSLFALAFSDTRHDHWAGSSGLTLIEFDRELPLPPAGKVNLETSESLALAALRLISRAAMEILMRARGGVYVIDEAHHYLASDEGASSLDRLGREGRSMGLLPIFVTQRPSDLLAVDMESFMSRVMCMKLNDETQAVAALQLCRLEPTQARIEFLRTAGPRRGSDGVPGRPALGIFRDLYDRHAVVSVGPVPEHLRLAMSTNRTDREQREAQTPTPGQSPSTEVQL